MKILCSVLFVALLWWPAKEARAIEGGKYDFPNVCRPVSILGQFSAAKSSYKFSGSCLLGKFSYNWTAEAAYSPKDGFVQEGIVLTDGRNQGEVYSSMTCRGDPWLGSATCINVKAESHGDIVFYVNKQTYTERLQSLVMGRQSPLTPDLSYDRGSLLAKRDADLNVEADAMKAKADKDLRQGTQPLVPFSAGLYPVIVSPAAEQRFLNQSPVPIKLAPPQPWADTQVRPDGTPVKTAKSVTMYMVRIERKDPSGQWLTHTNVPVGAIQAESAGGFIGFGAGAPPAFLSVPGRWRLSAQVTAPQQSGWSEWVEFEVMEPVMNPSTSDKNKLLKPPTKLFGK